MKVGTERKQVLLLLPLSYQTLLSGVGQVPSLLFDFSFGARKDGLNNYTKLKTKKTFLHDSNEK